MAPHSGNRPDELPTRPGALLPRRQEECQLFPPREMSSRETPVVPRGINLHPLGTIHRKEGEEAFSEEQTASGRRNAADTG